MTVSHAEAPGCCAGCQDFVTAIDRASRYHVSASLAAFTRRALTTWNRRLASDLSPYDVSKYSVSFVNGKSLGGRIRFHLGEPIKVEWHAPKNHSRRDWIGIYRVRSTLSRCLLYGLDISPAGWCEHVKIGDQDRISRIVARGPQ